jgi:histone acetyltransferase (RNA polymerase elongator complex component)
VLVCPHPAGAIARPPSPTVPAGEGILPSPARSAGEGGRPQARPGEGTEANRQYILPEFNSHPYILLLENFGNQLCKIMRRKHYNIPIFIPNAACPHKCVFCDQKKISGADKVPTIDMVHDTIEKYLATMQKESEIEIAFFGGNFTGIPDKEQEKFLQAAYKYVKEGRVKGIRVSTRPDYIDEDKVSLLKHYGVTAVELGAQSMDNEVLKLSGRGHSPDDVIKASSVIKKAEISLGLQMMIGLPGDTKEKAVMTARKIASIGADTARIYPTLVIKGTELETLYLANKYTPLSIKDAADWSAVILQIFEEHDIDVIRIGLHPNDGFLSGESLIAGPFHISFRELVLTEIWRKLLERFLFVEENEKLIIYVNPGEYNYAVGYEAGNKKMLLEKFKTVIFKKEPSLNGRYYGSMYL